VTLAEQAGQLRGFGPARCRSSMIPKSGHRFAEQIMLKQ
jgi:hypothetical protein